MGSLSTLSVLFSHTGVYPAVRLDRLDEDLVPGLDGDASGADRLERPLLAGARKPQMPHDVLGPGVPEDCQEEAPPRGQAQSERLWRPTGVWHHVPRLDGSMAIRAKTMLQPCYARIALDPPRTRRPTRGQNWTSWTRHWTRHSEARGSLEPPRRRRKVQGEAQHIRQWTAHCKSKRKACRQRSHLCPFECCCWVQAQGTRLQYIDTIHPCRKV